MISQLSNPRSFPRRRAVHWDEDDKAFTPLCCKPARWHNVIGDSSIHRARGHDTLSTCRIRPPRHCGLDPQSRGEGQGIQQGQHNRQNPLSLDGIGPKPVPVPDTGAEGEQDNPTQDRHSRVGGPFIGTRTIRRLRLCAASAHAGTA